MSRTAARNKRMAAQGLFFVVAMHPAVFGVLWWWSGGVDPWLVLKVLAFDGCYYWARRCEPRYGSGTGVGEREDVSWCEECQVARGVRMMHCKTCKKCIYKWDHHCALLNGCVGGGNHGSYVVFLLASTVSLFYLADALFSTARRPYLSPDNFPPLFLTLIVVMLQAISAGLLTWHLYLILTNQTSPEVLHPEKCFWLTSPSPPSSPPSAPNFLSWVRQEFLASEQDTPLPRTWSSSV